MFWWVEVAYGAALQAAILNGDKLEKNLGVYIKDDAAEPGFEYWSAAFD